MKVTAKKQNLSEYGAMKMAVNHEHCVMIIEATPSNNTYNGQTKQVFLQNFY